MPLAAYLPDPGKWIDTATPSPSAARPKQRPLTAIRHGLPTPPTSNPRGRSRSSTSKTDENGPRATAKAGPSRLRDEGRPAGRGGLAGWLTPPHTAAGPSRNRLDQIKGEEDVPRARGSPAPRYSGHPHDIGAPLGLKSKRNMDHDWKSDPEEEAVDTRRSRGGPSRLSSSKTSRHTSERPRLLESPKPQSAIKPSRMLKNAFSSGELSDLPPEYSSDHDEPPVPPATRQGLASSPAPVIVPKPKPTPTIPPSLSSKRRTLATARDSPAPLPSPSKLAEASTRPSASRTRSSSSPPEATQHVITQPPRAVLEKHWRMNGMSSEHIGPGGARRQLAGNSAWYLEQEQMRRQAERKKLDKAESLQLLDEVTENAKAVKERVRKIKKHLLLEDTDEEGGDDVSAAVETPRKGQSAVHSSTRILRSERRAPLSPMRLNGSGAIRSTVPGSPTPRKSAKRKLSALTPHLDPEVEIAPPRQPGRQIAPASPLPNDVVTRSPGTAERTRTRFSSAARAKYSRSRSRSSSVKPLSLRARADDHFASIMAAAERDAREKDEAIARAELQQRITPADALSQHALHAELDPCAHSEVAGSSRRSGKKRHHNVTPPKKRRYTDQEAEARFDFPPPPLPDFSSSPRSSQEMREAEKDFKPVDVVETLMTWSLGGDGQGPIEQDAEVVGSGDLKQVPLDVETQSIPASVASHSFPRFLPSQSAPQGRDQAGKLDANRKPSGSGWTALDQGILSVPHAGIRPEASPSHRPSAAKKRKSTGSTPSDRPEKQSKLEAFGIVKEKPEKRIRDFIDDFAAEAELEEADEPDVANKATARRGAPLRAVPDAPYHPDLRPAGIRALRECGSAPRPPRQIAAGPSEQGRDRSSPPLFSPPSSPAQRAPARSDTPSRPGDAATPISTHSPFSSSLMTDSTDEQEMPRLDPGLQDWWDALGSQARD